MAIIQREDGTQLVLRGYRETLSLANTTLFRQHAFLISEMHGYFVKFFSRGGKQIESVFSSDAGYILAEMIWAHFNKPDNMIFCEAINEHTFICISVRDGIIFSDGEFTAEELREELAGTISMQGNAVIYLYGKIPGFNEAPGSDRAAFLPENLKNVVWLTTSLINTIEPTPEFELTPLQQAISDLQLSKASQRKALWLIVLSVITILCIIAYPIYYFSNKSTIQQVDPLQNFKFALTSPSPLAEIQQSLEATLLIDSIPGWQLNKAEIKNSQLSGTIFSYGGSANNLLNWSANHKAYINFNQSNTEINMPLSALINRTAPVMPSPLMQTNATLIDNFMRIMPKKILNLGAVTRHGIYSTLEVNIVFQSLTPGTILLIGNALNALPVTVDSITLTKADNFFNGNIKLTVYGN